MSDFILKPSLLLPLALLASYTIYSLYVRKGAIVLPDLPWLNKKEGEWFSKLRARLRNTINYKAALQDAYENYSKKDRSCIMPTLEGQFIVLPTSCAEWVTSQPDHILSAIEEQRQELEFDFTFPDPALTKNPTHVHIINASLTRQLGNLTMDISEELAMGIDETWGMDTSAYKNIPVFDNLMGLVARATNRTFVGLPLCRNKDLLAAGSGFAAAVPFSSGLLRFFPLSIKPLAAAIITIPNSMYFRRFRKVVDPEIYNRLAEFDRREADPEKKAPEPERNDFLQWHINYAKKTSILSELEPRMIASRLLMLNFAAIHTTTFSATNVIFDLVSTNPLQRVLEQLREEVESILAEDDGQWTKRGLQKMVKMDSVLRESQRINSFLGLGLSRKVLAPDGITTPQGIHCPAGASIAVPVYGIHNDPNIFPDPDQFKPFRFAELRGDVEQSDAGLLKKANLGFVTTSPKYLPFGHGRHACPGRFFAANELKLMVAYMVLNYDFEMLETRPPSKWLGAVLLPPMKEKIRVKRRKMSSTA